MKNKLKDYYYKFYYIITNISIKRFWKNLNRWFSYYPICRKIYDFDYSSILAIERHQIKRVKNSIAKAKIYEGYERDVQIIDLLLRILNIIEEDGCSKRIGKPIEFKPCNDNETLYELVSDPNEYWTIPVYINTKNAKRFNKINIEKYNDPKCGNLWKDHLRLQKAWHLYHIIKEYNLRKWWW